MVTLLKLLKKVSLIKNFLKYRGVKAFLGGVRPCVVGLILSTALTMGLSKLIGLSRIGQTLSFDICGIIISAVLITASTVYTKIKKKKPSPIIMILASACLGAVLYPLF